MSVCTSISISANKPPRKPSMLVREPIRMERGLLVHVSPYLKDEDTIYLCKYAVLESSSTTTPAKRVALQSSLGEVQLGA